MVTEANVWTQTKLQLIKSHQKKNAKHGSRKTIGMLIFIFFYTVGKKEKQVETYLKSRETQSTMKTTLVLNQEIRF